jgi:hypothetical protein
MTFAPGANVGHPGSQWADYYLPTWGLDTVTSVTGEGDGTAPAADGPWGTDGNGKMVYLKESSHSYNSSAADTYHRYTTWTWEKTIDGVDVPVLGTGIDQDRQHNPIPGDIQMEYDFAKHYSVDLSSGDRYYSASAFKADPSDAVKIWDPKSPYN